MATITATRVAVTSFSASTSAESSNGKLKNLVTKEDPNHLHKVLGSLCLLHYIYRFSQVGATDMGFRGDAVTAACVALHVFLSCSSLIFHLPKMRIKEGSRIWPEYRLHSIIFACRSLACMAVVCFESLTNATAPNYYLNAVIIVATMVAADLATHYYKDHHSSTIQDLDAPAAMKFFFSVMQFNATMGCLFGLRRYSTQFLYTWIIQFTAFLMTLRRKNLLPHTPLVILYGFMLFFGLCVATNDHTRIIGWAGWAAVQGTANFAAFLRLGCKLNKYVMWVGVAAWVQWLRDAVQAGVVPSEFWFAYYGLSVVTVLHMGWKYVLSKSVKKE
jgi:hypothetical protein